MKRVLPLSVALILFVALAGNAQADPGHLDFTVHKLDSGVPGNTLLIVAGIQGDEPGGFSAASLILSHYKITRGSVWVVPNLNFLSIVKCSRGVHGDMNRKFAFIRKNDPDYRAIEEIKSLILDPQVDIILNMHDGSGFYREKYYDWAHCSDRWGQCVVIDQESMDTERYSELGDIARTVAEHVNEHALKEEHVINVKNTRTREGDMEMEKTLTYFAVTNGKASFGLEASKTFSDKLRAYYHLHMLEGFMDVLDIGYERKLTLTAEGVGTAINENLAMAFFGNKIYLDLADVRNRLGYFPLRKDGELAFATSSPLMTVVGSRKAWDVYYGNKSLTKLTPQYFDYDYSVDRVTMHIDGQAQPVGFGEMVAVRDSFMVQAPEDCRVNVIGFTKKGLKNESGVTITKKSVIPKYSVDKAGNIYRVEVYKGEKFAGMVLVNFNGKPATLDPSYPRVVSQNRGK